MIAVVAAAALVWWERSSVTDHSLHAIAVILAAVILVAVILVAVSAVVLV